MTNHRESAFTIGARLFGRWLRRRDDRRHRKMLLAMLTPTQVAPKDMYQPGLRPAPRRHR